MSIPVLVLLAFASWTLLTLFVGVGAYRWARILSGEVPISQWRADARQGSERYQRAVRAHLNCVENLPVYAALVVTLLATGVQSRAIDALAITMLAARIGQTLSHVLLTPTDRAAAIRFGFFFAQVVCMIAIGALAFIGARGLA